MKPTMTLTKRAADAVYWMLGILAMTASATIIHMDEGDNLLFMGLLGLAPPLLTLIALPFFPDDEQATK